MSNAAHAIAVPVTAAATKVSLLCFIAELGDAADDDGVNAQQLAEFGGAGGVGAVGVGEILLGHDFIQSLALDDGVGAVLDQVGDQQVGDAPAHVHVVAEHGGGGTHHGGVVEVEHGDAGPVVGRSLRGGRTLYDPRNNRQEKC